MAMDSSDSDAESMKAVPRIHRKCPQKDEPVKWPWTGGRTLSATNSKNIQDIPSDTKGDAIGAHENVEELRSQDAQLAKMIQESQKAHHIQDLETVFHGCHRGGWSEVLDLSSVKVSTKC